MSTEKEAYLTLYLREILIWTNFEFTGNVSILTSQINESFLDI